jgi:flagellar basal-body rod modification protein FlgD
MTTVTSTGSTSSSAADQAARTENSLNSMDLDTFLKLMLAELQNQDPLEPMDNEQLLSQISQIREVGATDQLTKTLDSVLLGQNIASATNLIGASVTALSDDAQPVSGVVDRVSIDDGAPKLRLQLNTQAVASSAEGDVEEGTYSYKVVWQNDDGELEGIELSGDNAAMLTNDGAEHSIELSNLPISTERKEIYRTDKSGQGNYQLVGVLTDGSESTFVDRLSDAERSLTTFSGSFQPVVARRTFNVSLNNVSEIRPPASSP